MNQFYRELRTAYSCDGTTQLLKVIRDKDGNREDSTNDSLEDDVKSTNGIS
jgi:hypothetical protein